MMLSDGVIIQFHPDAALLITIFTCTPVMEVHITVNIFVAFSLIGSEKLNVNRTVIFKFKRLQEQIRKCFEYCIFKQHNDTIGSLNIFDQYLNLMHEITLLPIIDSYMIFTFSCNVLALVYSELPGSEK